MKKIILLSLSILTFINSYSTHIVGGDISVKYLSPNTFEVKLRFYRDCGSVLNAGFDLPSIQLGLFDKITNATINSLTLPFISSQPLTLGDSCYTPSGICVEEGIYADTFNIPNNTNGYYITWQRCCRNTIISNINLPGNAGIVYYVEIPDPAVINSSPVFGGYPNAYFCSGINNIQNFSCTDIDGDQLVYSLVTPLNGNSSGTTVTVVGSAPYPDITWQAPFSSSDMVGGTPVISINPSTGVISASPLSLGTYVFAVKVEEYRAGVKIGEIRRDIQYQVINCPSNQPPSFSLPALDTSSYAIMVGDSLCIPVMASDPNPDWITLTASNSDMFTLGLATFPADSAQTTVQSNLCVIPTCEHIREAPYHVTLYVKDSSCYGSNVIKNEIDIYVTAPPNGDLTLIPNTFTPNGDGINEVFKVSSNNVSTCFDKFNIAIYNRYGIKLYESDNFYFQWDGRVSNGMKAKDGVYFYVIEAKFKDKSSSYKGIINLYR